MATKASPPSIHLVAFSCPHCGAYTSHTWFSTHVRVRPASDGAPGVIDANIVERVRKDSNVPAEQKADLISWAEKAARGEILLADKADSPFTLSVTNIDISRCFVCKHFAMQHDRLIHPPATTGPQPNADLSADVLRDYKEAQSIVALSPRGAAALLRLAIQKLCKELGEEGKKIDADIASLVKKGLNPLVQKSLDIVRVVATKPFTQA